MVPLSNIEFQIMLQIKVEAAHFGRLPSFPSRRKNAVYSLIKRTNKSSFKGVLIYSLIFA
jgi:hypothetical protein